MPKSKPAPPRPRPRTLSDPLTPVPPPNETPDQKYRRIQAENDAKRRSDSIDEMLRQERIDKKKNKPEVNVLLLGQSESGKSTTLKQFQLLHSPKAFYAERIAWRTVIYLNLVRSILRILDALAPESDALDDHDDIDPIEPIIDIIISSNGRPPSAILGTQVRNYELYRKSLAPLVGLEDRLTRLLSAPDKSESEPVQTGRHDQNIPPTHVNGINGRPAPTTAMHRQQISMSRSISAGFFDYRTKEPVVRSPNWKLPFSLGGIGEKGKSTIGGGEIEGWWTDPDDPVHALNACARYMIDLWRDPEVRQILREKRLRLEEDSGFFLDDIPRITAKKYIPTDSDVLKARLKTTGVVEHTFTVSSGTNAGVQWRIYDVGGARNQRAAWAPYFEHVNAIIFLAPISAFDQALAEDPRINRLEDSLLLWKTLVQNQLLANVNIVLFLNKCDLLQAKLESGVRLGHHMSSYGNRPSDYKSVVKYFYNKFSALHQSFSPNKERELYIHFTAVTDTRRTAVIISSVRDIIIKKNLRTMRLV